MDVMLGLFLLLISWHDLQFQQIPDALNLGLGICGVARLLILQPGDLRWLPARGLILLLLSVLTGLIQLCEWLLCRPLLGMGDMKLFAALAFWVEPPVFFKLFSLSFLLLIAPLIWMRFFVAARHRRDSVAFAPWISLSVVLASFDLLSSGSFLL